MMNLLTSPTFINLLNDPSVKTVAIVGTGGGFDFMHCGHFLPLLKAAGKKVVIHSYSFGDPQKIGNAVPFDPVHFFKYLIKEKEDHALSAHLNPIMSSCNTWPKIVLTNAACVPDPRYAPEVALATFLDQKYGNNSLCPDFEYYEKMKQEKQRTRSNGDDNDDNNNNTPPCHWIYTSYSRDWTAKALCDFYQLISHVHKIDAILAIDGGSDSLMKGDEDGLGDPIEDAVTVAAISQLPETTTISDDEKSPSSVPFVPIRILVALGFGCDRFNRVSDDNSFKAIAELTQLSRVAGNDIEKRNCFSSEADQKASSSICGFLGSMAMERFSAGSQFYSELIEFTQDRFSFRSVIANSIVEAAKGAYGSEVVPESLKQRVKPGNLYLWPLMSFAFAFDMRLMYQRSIICKPLFEQCNSIGDMYSVLYKMTGDLP